MQFQPTLRARLPRALLLSWNNLNLCAPVPSAPRFCAVRRSDLGRRCRATMTGAVCQLHIERHVGAVTHNHEARFLDAGRLRQIIRDRLRALLTESLVARVAADVVGVLSTRI